MKEKLILIGVILIAILIAGLTVLRIRRQGPGRIPLATRDIFVDHSDYIGRKFRFRGCFEPHECSMATEECSIDNLEMCCDCIKNYDTCPIVDLQHVPKEKLVEVRGTNETKYRVEVVGTVIQVSKMRPVAINATDLTILGECQLGT